MDEREAAGSHWADNKEEGEEEQQQKEGEEEEEVPCHSIAVRSQPGCRASLLLARGGSLAAGELRGRRRMTWWGAGAAAAAPAAASASDVDADSTPLSDPSPTHCSPSFQTHPSLPARVLDLETFKGSACNVSCVMAVLLFSLEFKLNAKTARHQSSQGFVERRRSPAH